MSGSNSLQCVDRSRFQHTVVIIIMQFFRADISDSQKSLISNYYR